MTKDCDLKICTTRCAVAGDAGGEDVLSIESTARYYLKNNKHYLIFELDNDKCHIEYDEKGLMYNRQGDLTYKLSLRNGSSSEMTLKTALGTMRIDYMVYMYKTDIKDDTAEINIDYRSAGEDYHMKIEVSCR